MTQLEQPSRTSSREVIKQSPRVEGLLEAFAVRSGLLPQGAHRTEGSAALAESLRRLLSQALAHVSVCFAHGSRLWVFTGMASESLSRERNAPVLWVNAYSGEGILIEAGAWAFGHDGTWHRCGDHVDI